MPSLETLVVASLGTLVVKDCSSLITIEAEGSRYSELKITLSNLPSLSSLDITYGRIDINSISSILLIRDSQ